MSGLVAFVARFGTEERCIEHLAGLHWPGGYVCARCGGLEAWRLKKRPRVYECRGCGHQESVTAGTIFHRTRTGLPHWFLAAYLMGKDKRGVSAKFLQRELGVAYQTAWTIAHKLRHGLSEVTTCMGPYAVKRIFRFLDVGSERSDWSLRPDRPGCAPQTDRGSSGDVGEPRVRRGPSLALGGDLVRKVPATPSLA